MGYHPRQGCGKTSSLITTRTKNSELWFVSNKKLEAASLGYVAKYSLVYQAKIYALSIEGSHMHMCALFPDMNRSDFMRDDGVTLFL